MFCQSNPLNQSVPDHSFSTGAFGQMTCTCAMHNSNLDSVRKTFGTYTKLKPHMFYLYCVQCHDKQVSDWDMVNQKKMIERLQKENKTLKDDYSHLFKEIDAVFENIKILLDGEKMIKPE